MAHCPANMVIILCIYSDMLLHMFNHSQCWVQDFSVMCVYIYKYCLWTAFVCDWVTRKVVAAAAVLLCISWGHYLLDSPGQADQLTYLEILENS